MLSSSEIIPFLEIIFEASFYITTLVFIVFSLALAYHWFSYTTDRKIAATAMSIYIIGSFPFFALMSATLISF